MKRIFFLLTYLLFASVALADDPCGDVKAGSTDVTCTITMRAAATGVGTTGHAHTDIALSYYREGAASVTAVTEAALAALNTAHTDGGIEEIQNGEYRADFPDAAFASGASFVTLFASATDDFTWRKTIALPSYRVDDLAGPDGTAQAGGASSITLGASESATDDFFNGQLVSISGGTGKGQSRCITDYTGSSKVAAVSPAWLVQPDDTSEYFVSADNCDQPATLADGGITNAKIADGAIGDTELAASAANRIADTTLRRTTANVEASSYGDTLSQKSLYGAAAKQTHRSQIAGGNWIVYRADDSTTLSSTPVTTNASAAPITAIGAAP